MLHTYSPSPAQKAQHEAHKARRLRLGYVTTRKADPLPTPVPKPPKPPNVISKYRLIFISRPANAHREPSISSIISEVAKKHRLSPADLFSNRRSVAVVSARYEAMWRARHETSHSLPSIGRAFKRDHTTVIYGIAKHEKSIASTSAAGGIETDGRGNIAKPAPARSSIGQISITDIRINSNGHHA